MVHDAVLNVRLPREVIEELDAIAEMRRVTIPRKAHSRNSVVREALGDWLDRRQVIAPQATRVRQRSAGAR